MMFVNKTELYRAASGATALAILTASIVLAGCANEDDPPRAKTPEEKLTAIAAEIREHFAVPGLSVAVADISDDVVVATSGVRRADRTDLLTPDDFLHIGSVTKNVTATMVATLVEDGALRWNETLSEILPALANSMHADFRNVTLQQLLEMRAGLQPYTGADIQDLPTFTGTPDEQRAAFVTWLLQHPPASPTGEFVYSNASHAVAAVIAQEATGKTWDTLLAERLFNPLGIRAVVGWPGTEGDSDTQPWGHLMQDGDWTPVDPNGDHHVIPPLAPAGDLSLTMRDLAVLWREHLRAFAGEPLALGLSKERVLELHTGLPNSGYPTRGPWWIVEHEGSTMSLKVGSAGTFLCVSLVDHSGELVLTVAINASRTTMDEIDTLANGLIAAVYARVTEEQVIP